MRSIYLNDEVENQINSIHERELNRAYLSSANESSFFWKKKSFLLLLYFIAPNGRLLFVKSVICTLLVPFTIHIHMYRISRMNKRNIKIVWILLFFLKKKKVFVCLCNELSLFSFWHILVIFRSTFGFFGLFPISDCVNYYKVLKCRSIRDCEWIDQIR